MPSEVEQNAWVQRVLGISLIASDEAAAVRVLPIWRDAKEAVDARIEMLARELRGYGDEDLNIIADQGLFGLTEGGQTVVLTRALMEHDAARPERRTTAAAAVRVAVASYRGIMLTGNRRVEMVDTNPFGVNVGLADTLGRALGEIEAALA